MSFKYDVRVYFINDVTQIFFKKASLSGEHLLKRLPIGVLRPNDWAVPNPCQGLLSSVANELALSPE